MTLTGIFKSILLVITSVLIWGTPISPLQCLGYSTALVGLVYYSLGHEQLAAGFRYASTWVAEAWGGPGEYDDTDDESGVKDSLLRNRGTWTPSRRRAILVTGALCLISSLVVVGIWRGPAALRRAQDAFPGLLGPERLG